MGSRAVVLTLVGLLLVGGLSYAAMPGGVQLTSSTTGADGGALAGGGNDRAGDEPEFRFKGGIAGTGDYSEPSIDISPDGRIFVTGIRGLPSRSPIWEYLPEYRGWIQRGVTLHRLGEIGGGDADLEIDSAGRYYHSDLSLANDGVAFSEDGVTWIGSPAGHWMPGNDRQWFAHYDDQYLYLVTNNLAAGLVSYRYEIGLLGAAGGLMAPLEVPVTGTCHCGPPGFPSVDQTSGFVYIPINQMFAPSAVRFGAEGALHVWRSPNDGVTWSRMAIPGAGSAQGFPVSAVDEAGNAYVVWGEEKNGKHDLYLSRSTSRGLVWSEPVRITGAGTHVFPWIVAGEEGKVGIAWYGTDVEGDPETMPKGTKWRVHYAQSLDALAPAPSFRTWDVIGAVHDGSISLSGLTGTADRSLGDFLSLALNPVDGAAYVAFINNDPSTPASQRGVWVERMPAGASALT